MTKNKDLTRAPASHTGKFHTDEASARDYLEGIRWPNGPVCPHCGGADRQNRIEANPSKKVRPGLLHCGHCRSQYTVTVGTVFADSKVPLHKWVHATHLMCASKKGCSSKQLERVIGVTYKTAWFMSHRIREAMKSEGGMLGGTGPTEESIVEADETYITGKPGRQMHRRVKRKDAIFALVERKGQVRSFHIPTVTGDTLRPILRAHASHLSTVYTDEHGAYSKLDRDFYEHQTVAHKKREYARGPVSTNTVEGYFSILKRGLIGTYHHVSEAHLQRYVTEFDFRYNHRTKLGYTDDQRANVVLKEIAGKRLTYKAAGHSA